MNFLPILQRELRVRARARATFWLRFAAALAGFLICVQQLLVSGPLIAPAALGHHVFIEVVVAAFLLSCSGCLLTADVLSGERRAGTLGLLFLTDIKSFDVLVGKMISVGFSSLLVLFALVPALMLPAVVGGLDIPETGREFIVLLTVLFFALAAGLRASAPQRERARSVRHTLLAMSLILFIPVVCSAIATHGPLYWIGWFSPIFLLVNGFSFAYSGDAAPFWLSLAAIQALGWSFLVHAGLRLRRAVQEDIGAAMERPLAEIEEAKRALGLGTWQPAQRESAPIQWVAFRQYGVSIGFWVLGVVAMACSRWMSLIVQPFTGRTGTFGFLLTAWPLGLAGAAVGGALIAFVASRFFAGVRSSGELELLLTTPLGAEQLISDQWHVLKRLFVFPVLGLQIATLLPVLGAVNSAIPGFARSLPSYSLISVLLSIANTFFGVQALCWLSLWLGLKSKSQSGAVVWSVTLAQGLPWLISVVFSSVPLMSDFLSLLYYAWLIPASRRYLLSDLAGVAPMPFKFLNGLAAP